MRYNRQKVFLDTFDVLVANTSANNDIYSFIKVIHMCLFQ